MRKTIINILLLACIAYLGFYLKKFWEVPYQGEQTVLAQAKPRQNKAQEDNETGKRQASLADYKIIGERNLFRPDRREWTPPPPPPPPPPKPAAPEPPPPPPPSPPPSYPDPILIGIIDDNGENAALMRGHKREEISSPHQQQVRGFNRYAPPTRYRIIEEPMGRFHVGDIISEAKIVKIDSDRVVLEREGKVFQVLLRITKKGSSSSSPGHSGFVPPPQPGGDMDAPDENQQDPFMMRRRPIPPRMR
ncbi:MAG: hypothetical protein HZA78_04990 [Candidatus Schekmanbacteria bacterium]|nr:hypothetical protein [Candidatus Schekmanbacteria bacterium]